MTRVRDVRTVLGEAFAHIEHRHERRHLLGRVPTGFDHLDAALVLGIPGAFTDSHLEIADDDLRGGFPVGLLTRVAGDVADEFVLHVVSRAIASGISTLLVTTSNRDAVLSLIALRSNVHERAFDRGELHDRDWPVIARSASSLDESPLHLADSVLTLVAEARALVVERELRFVAILGEAASARTAGQIARDLDVTVVAVCNDASTSDLVVCGDRQGFVVHVATGSDMPTEVRLDVRRASAAIGWRAGRRR